MASNNLKTFPFSLDGISRKDLLEAEGIKKHGHSFLQQRNSFCNCKNVRRDILRFALKCVTDIINQQNHLKFTTKQPTKPKFILLPHKNNILRLVDPKKPGYVMSKITHNTISYLRKYIMSK